MVHLQSAQEVKASPKYNVTFYDQKDGYEMKRANTPLEALTLWAKMEKEHPSYVQISSESKEDLVNFYTTLRAEDKNTIMVILNIQKSVKSSFLYTAMRGTNFNGLDWEEDGLYPFVIG